jgi:hypothetical protein
LFHNCDKFSITGRNKERLPFPVAKLIAVDSEEQSEKFGKGNRLFRMDIKKALKFVLALTDALSVLSNNNKLSTANMRKVF